MMNDGEAIRPRASDASDVKFVQVHLGLFLLGSNVSAVCSFYGLWQWRLIYVFAGLAQL